jgi:hypothetical protein
VGGRGAAGGVAWGEVGWGGVGWGAAGSKLIAGGCNHIAAGDLFRLYNVPGTWYRVMQGVKQHSVLPCLSCADMCTAAAAGQWQQQQEEEPMQHCSTALS